MRQRASPQALPVFAHVRVEMKAIETVLHLRRAFPARIENMVPDHVRQIVSPHGLSPGDGERRGD